MHNQSNNTAPQLSLSSHKLNGDMDVAAHSRANGHHSSAKAALTYSRGDGAANQNYLSSEKR